MKLFVDESGNSGANLFDSQQPLYAVAAIRADSSQESSLAQEVAKVRRVWKVQGGGLKGGRMVRSASGRKAICDIASACHRLGIEVSMMVLQKPFMASAVIVEEYTDHTINHNYSPAWTHPSAEKEQLALDLYRSLPSATVVNWWKAKGGASEPDMKKAHDALCGVLRLHPQLCAFGESIADVDYRDLIEPAVADRGDKLHRYSPNTVVFGWALNQLESRMHEIGLSSVDLVHDQQSEFKDAYERWFQHISSSLDIQTAAGHLVPVRNISSLRFEDSSGCLPLQVADCMAALARSAVTEASAGGAPSVWRQYRGVLRDLSSSSSEYLPWVIGPLDWQPVAYRALIGVEQ